MAVVQAPDRLAVSVVRTLEQLAIRIRVLAVLGGGAVRAHSGRAARRSVGPFYREPAPMKSRSPCAVIPAREGSVRYPNARAPPCVARPYHR